MVRTVRQKYELEFQKYDERPQVKLDGVYMCLCRRYQRGPMKTSRPFDRAQTGIPPLDAERQARLGCGVTVWEARCHTFVLYFSGHDYWTCDTTSDTSVDGKHNLTALSLTSNSFL